MTSHWIMEIFFGSFKASYLLSDFLYKVKVTRGAIVQRVIFIIYHTLQIRSDMQNGGVFD